MKAALSEKWGYAKMWYVIQSRSGDEEVIKSFIETLEDRDSYRRLFIPLYEEVRRSRGKNRIMIKKMFPQYLFVDTENPEEIFDQLKNIPRFKRILSMEERDHEKVFIPVEREDEEFLDSIIDDGIMHVSYIRMKNHRYIEKVVGPLARYRNHITKLDIPHRRAIVEAEIFGKKRKIRFGLWAEGDPPLPWLDEQKEQGQVLPIDRGAVPDIGIHPGDKVKDDSGIYGDLVFTVKSVNPGRRTVSTTFSVGGIEASLELRADEVSLINE